MKLKVSQTHCCCETIEGKKNLDKRIAVQEDLLQHGTTGQLLQETFSTKLRR